MIMVELALTPDFFACVLCLGYCDCLCWTPHQTIATRQQTQITNPIHSFLLQTRRRHPETRFSDKSLHPPSAPTSFLSISPFCFVLFLFLFFSYAPMRAFVFLSVSVAPKTPFNHSQPMTSSITSVRCLHRLTRVMALRWPSSGPCWMQRRKGYATPN